MKLLTDAQIDEIKTNNYVIFDGTLTSNPIPVKLVENFERKEQ